MSRCLWTTILAIAVSISWISQPLSGEELAPLSAFEHGDQEGWVDGEMPPHGLGCPDCVGGAGCVGKPGCVGESTLGSRWYAAQDYLLIRTHFSEALAFARVNDSLVGGVFNRHVEADELNFDYESSFRSTLGYHLNDCADIRFTFWHLDVDTLVTGVAGPGETIMDPYGGMAPTGAEIAAGAAVKMNVFDLEYVRPIRIPHPHLGFEYSAGLRFADVEQFADSTIHNGGVMTSRGMFETDFFGVGPYLSITGKVTPPRHNRLSLLAKGGMALLVGQYDVSTQFTVPGVVVGGQSADRTRMVPVLESELGGQWAATDWLTFSAGWMFQGWMNLGASGGTFDTENTPLGGDAAFVGTDDADIMSFDGLFIRGQVNF